MLDFFLQILKYILLFIYVTGSSPLVLQWRPELYECSNIISLIFGPSQSFYHAIFFIGNLLSSLLLPPPTLQLSNMIFAQPYMLHKLPI